jgi:hypothetical protein
VIVVFFFKGKKVTMQPDPKLYTVADVVEYLIVCETLIKGARALYVQCMNNEFGVDSDTKSMMLSEIEEYGLALAKEKTRVLYELNQRALPITPMRGK